MALQTTINHLKQMLGEITQDLTKADGGNKAASQRVRTMTVKLEKLAKVYRKESIASEKNTKGPKTAKPKAKHSASAGTKKVAAAKKHHVAAATTKVKAKPKAKAHAAIAKPRAMSLKKPTAKLPAKKRR